MSYQKSLRDKIYKDIIDANILVASFQAQEKSHKETGIEKGVPAFLLVQFVNFDRSNFGLELVQISQTITANLWVGLCKGYKFTKELGKSSKTC